MDFVPVQANMAFSITKGTIRGMHLQVTPAIEAKLVRCTRGVIFDVVTRPQAGVADVRRMVWRGAECRERPNALCARATARTAARRSRSSTEIHYMASEFFTPGAVRGFRFDDPAFAIQWPLAATDGIRSGS